MIIHFLNETDSGSEGFSKNELLDILQNIGKKNSFESVDVLAHWIAREKKIDERQIPKLKRNDEICWKLRNLYILRIN